MRTSGKLNKDDTFEWVKGDVQVSALPADVTEYLNTYVFPYFYNVFEEEDNKEVVERVLENLTELANDFGPAVFNQDNLNKIIQIIIKFLDKRTFCQTKVMEMDEEDLEGEEGEDAGDVEDLSGEEESEEDDGIDHDEIILGNVTDLIIAISRALGNHFAPYFDELTKHLIVYTSDKHPKSDKNMATGCIAEVFASCESVIPKYFNDFLVLVEALSSTKDNKINRNMAYSLGVLAEHAQQLFLPHVANALVILERLHSNTTEADALDNIVAASTRIIEF